jgi:hypothetical protein
MVMDKINYFHILNVHYNNHKIYKYMVMVIIIYQWYIYKIYVILLKILHILVLLVMLKDKEYNYRNRDIILLLIMQKLHKNNLLLVFLRILEMGMCKYYLYKMYYWDRILINLRLIYLLMIYLLWKIGIILVGLLPILRRLYRNLIYIEDWNLIRL